MNPVQPGSTQLSSNLRFLISSWFWVLGRSWIVTCSILLRLLIIRDLILVIPESFPYFLQFKSEFCNKKFMIWATVSSLSCFYWLYRASPSSAKNIINLISVLTIWWCPCVELSLVLLEEGVCYDQCVLLAKLCEPLPCFIPHSKAELACYYRYLLTFYFCILVPYDEKDIFFGC